MSKYTAKKRIWTGIGALAALVLLVCALMMIGGVSAALDIKKGNTVRITYSVGDLPSNTTGVSVTSEAQSVTVNSSECIVLPDLRPTVSGGLDAETFTVGGKSYSFTGWKISAADSKLPGETVFQPGDAITFDVLETYLANTATQGTYTLTLEALWGQCYFIRNPYTTMVYNYTNGSGFPVDTDNSTDKTGASDSNTGLTKEDPLATINGLYAKLREQGNNYDAYANVVMLTGDLDYFRDYGYDSAYYGYAKADAPASKEAVVFVSATYKSLGDVAFNFNYKPASDAASTDAQTLEFGNFRFDNINMLRVENTLATWYRQLNKDGYESTADTQFGEAIGRTFNVSTRAQDEATNQIYFETTARYNQSVPAYRLHAIPYLRVANCDYVVINGGLFTDLTGYHNIDKVGSQTELNSTWRVGRNAYINEIYGGNRAGDAISVNGNLTIFVTGGYVKNLYAGGGNSAAAGNTGSRTVYLLGVEGDTATGSYTKTALQITSVENGDGSTTETTSDIITAYTYYPNVATINVFYGANISRPMVGDVTVVGRYAKVNSTFYGGGDNSGTKDALDDTHTTLTGNVNINLTGTTVGGYLYGGGNFGKVDGSVTIDLIDGSYSRVYGGGQYDAVGSVELSIRGNAATNNVYGGGHRAIASVANAVTVNILENASTGNVYAGGDSGSFAGIPVLKITGGKAGSVFGGCWEGTVSGTDVYISGATAGTVYGGGGSANATVNGNTNVVVEGSAKVSGIYGGSYLSTVTGSASVSVSNATVTGSIYGGGESATTGPVTVNVESATVKGTASGGSYGGTINGNITLVVEKSDVNVVRGGGSDDTINGNITATVDNCTIVDNAVSGGENIAGGSAGSTGVVNGDIVLTIQNVVDVKEIYGGYNGTVYGDIHLTVDSVEFTKDTSHANRHIWAAGNGGDVRKDAEGNGGNTYLIVKDTTVQNIFGGGRSGSVVEGIAHVTVQGDTVGNAFFGGGMTNGTRVGGVIFNFEGGTAKYVFGGAQDDYVDGDVKLTASGGTVTEYLCGGNNKNGNISGDVTLTLEGVNVTGGVTGGSLNGGTIEGQITVNAYAGTSVAKNLYGGCGGVAYARTPDVNIYGGSYYAVFGGGISASVAATDVQIYGGSVNVLYGGGGAAGGTVTGDTNVKLDALDPSATDMSVLTIRGGGNGQGADVSGNTNIFIRDVSDGAKKISIGHYGGSGTVQEGDRNVLYGGGRYGAVARNANITLVDCVIGDGSKPVSVFGGGLYPSATVGNVIWSLTNVTIKDTDVADELASRFYGGGYFADVTEDVTTTVAGQCDFDAYYYGGGFYGKVGDTVTNNIDGNSIFRCDIFGGGRVKGSYTHSDDVYKNQTFEYDAKVHFAKTVIDGAGVEVFGEVYGAGMQATTDEAVLNIRAGRYGDFSAQDTNNGNIYGGAYSGATGTSTVLINGSAAVETERSVYGGGRIEGASNVSTVVTLDNPNAIINHHLMGGGIEGDVTQSTEVNIHAGKVGFNVYGGASTATVGTENNANTAVTINITGGDLKNVYGGGKGHADDENDSPVDAIVHGNIVLNILEGTDAYELDTFENIFGGGHSAKATVNGNITSTLDGINFTYFYGGGSRGIVNGNITNNATNFNLRDVYNAEGKATISGSAYFIGGGNYGAVNGNITNNLTGTIQGTKVSYLYNFIGGGNESAAVVTGTGEYAITNNLTGQMGYVTVAEQERDVSGFTIGKNIFGGGSSAPVYGNVKNVLTDLDMRKTYGTDGNIDGTYVYGGCNNAEIHGDVYLTLQGTDSNNLCKFRTVYGGNAYNRIHGTTYVTALDNVTTGRDFLVAAGRFKTDTKDASKPIATVDATYLKIDGLHSVIGDTFGGGHQGNVIGDTHVEILSGNIEVVYGSGSDTTATVGGNAYITIGSAETAPIIENQVYGSGNYGGVVGNTYVDVYGGTVQGEIYGGGKYGTVDGDTHVVLHNGTVNENAYGGGHYAAAVANGTFITVEQATLAKTVYGGGNEAPVQTTATVTINGGRVNSRVFGGGNAKTATVSDTKVYLFGGEIGLDAFGGGNLAPTGTTEVYEIGTTLTESIYGGGFQKGADVFSPNVTVIGGTMSSVYGGGYDGAVIDNPQTKTLEGNANVRIEGDPEEVLTIGETEYIPSDVLLKYLFGGGYRGTVEGNTYVVVHDASGRTYDWANRNVIVGTSQYTSRAIYGGGNYGKVNGTANLLLEDWCFGTSSADGPVYMYGGGSYAGATVGATNFVIRNCYYRPNSGRGFGGGYKAEVLGDSSFVLEGITNYNGTMFGGGENAAVHGTATSMVLDNAHIEECLYAGGRYASAPVGNTHVVIDAQDQYLAEFGNKKFTLEHTLYGGGILADVKGDTLVEFKNGSLNYSAYAGADIASVGGTATIKVSGNSKLNTSVYGGGRGDTRVAATGNSVVLITENAQIRGSVYGGGEGIKAVVHGTTDVTIDLNHTYDVTETLADTKNPTSGMTGVEITADASTAGSIGGSVYGGGNRGSVGAGTVIVGTNNAKITEVGKTKVTVKNGYIAGSVFGGGRGEPTKTEPYQTAMGAVFGSTETNIYGGYIAGKNGVGGVYGGGEKSRVYAEVGQKAVIVNVDATVADTDIAIYGSVFGGGDRGEGDTMNTSIPTTVGDVEVNIVGETTAENRTTPTQIYFKQGGVFGDGNLCNTEGNRVVNIQNFGTGKEPRADGSTLKTLYSIQRADTVNLINSDVVLIGLEDAMDSSDYEKYSISRVGALNMKEGSTVKLDSIVKFLGALHSDYQSERTFIDKGYNDVNNSYTGHDGKQENVDKLLDGEITTYINNDVTLKNNHTDYNTVCIANGRYLTVADENGTYGPVTGLYTLELLNAVPGEGGGFVYGDITGSTGDFICTTPYSAMARSADGYMDVIDNVGRLVDEDAYSYYYWYISGDKVQYNLNIDGYIGINKQDYSDSTAFAYADKTTAGNDQPLHYVLESVAVNDTLATLLNTYSLLSSADAVANAAGEAIAVEFKLSGESLGFLTKNGDKYGINNKTGLEGVQVEDDGAASQITANSLLYKLIDGTNNTLEVILYRSEAVDEWAEGLGVTVTLKLFQETGTEVYQPVENGAHTHVINTTMALRRMVPKQAIFAENRRNYVGVAGLTELHINEHSSFSMEVQTNYIPSAFPKTGSSTFVTSLNISSLPTGTKITMADLTGTVPTFYYYIKKGNEATVDLMNFMQMGTETTISDLTVKPAFVQAYEAQASEVVNERLLFVCDFEQVEESVWTEYEETSYNGTLQVNHLYNSKEIMEYTDESDNDSTAKVLTFAIHPTVEGLDAFSMSFDTQSADGEGDAESESGVFPAKGTSQFDVVLTESIVAIDTRYYEGKFALKLQMYLDDSATPVKLPDGITFECDGVTYYPDSSNEFAVVGVDGFGTHTVTMNTDLFGITGVTGKVTLKATVYSAPEPVYFNSILTPKVGEATFTLGAAEEHHLLVHCENSPTNLLLDKGEALQFTLTTKQTGDDEAVVSVDAYRKVDGAYTELVDLGALFIEEHQALAQTDGAAVPYSWILSDTAPEGTYRLVYTFADRVEYLYFIVN